MQVRNRTEMILARVVAIAYFCAALFITWDIWGHTMEIRETFWVPQHILFESSLLVAYFTSLVGWYRTRTYNWIGVSVASTVLTFGMILDALWHIVFQFQSLLPSNYSPPHFLMGVSGAVGSVFLLRIFFNEQDRLQQYFFLLLSGTVLFFSGGLPLMEWHPLTEMQFVGFWGAGVHSFYIVAVLIFLTEIIHGPMVASAVLLFFLAIGNMGMGANISMFSTGFYKFQNLGWLNAFSLLLPAFFIDLSRYRLQIFYRACVASLLYGGLLFSIASRHVALRVQYGLEETMIAITASLIGGVVAGAATPFLLRQFRSSLRFTLQNRKTAYLTIDDAPSVDMKQKVDFLIFQKIPAVWFCRGDYMEQRPEPVLHAIKNGHVIGNHMYSHPRSSDLSVEHICDQIKKTDEIIDHLYRQANVKRPAKYFRFPYGDKGDLRHGDLSQKQTAEGKKRHARIQKYLKSLGYTQPSFEKITYAYHRDQGIFEDIDWRWTFDVMEYAPSRVGRFELQTMEEVFARMDHDNLSQGIGINHFESDEILLVHDHAETIPHFENIIRRLYEKDMIFLSPLLSGSQK